MAEPSHKQEFRLLAEFRKLFDGRVYLHRASTQGDFVAMHFYEDLLAIERSPKLVSEITERRRGLNVQNRRHGIRARRGDGTFGEIVAGEDPILDEGFRVARGIVATIEIGVEVKVLAKAMIKQIDRVISDLRNQVAEFRKGGDNPLCIGIVGVNHANRYVSYEGEDRKYPTTGRGGFLHPAQEAAEAERRLRELAGPAFDEFLLLSYRATNEPPYPFDWVDHAATVRDYAAVLTRASSKYERGFSQMPAQLTVRGERQDDKDHDQQDLDAVRSKMEEALADDLKSQGRNLAGGYSLPAVDWFLRTLSTENPNVLRKAYSRWAEEIRRAASKKV